MQNPYISIGPKKIQKTSNELKRYQETSNEPAKEADESINWKSTLKRVRNVQVDDNQFY